MTQNRLKTCNFLFFLPWKNYYTFKEKQGTLFDFLLYLYSTNLIRLQLKNDLGNMPESGEFRLENSLNLNAYY